MQKIKIKYKYILYGIPNIDIEYSIDSFEIKKVNLKDYEEQSNFYIDKLSSIKGFYINKFNQNLIIDSNGDKYIWVMKSKDFFEKEINNNLSIDKSKTLKLLEKYKDIVTYKNDLIKRMRLELNVPVNVLFQIISIYDCNSNIISEVLCINDELFNINNNVFINQEIKNNSRIKLNYKKYYEVSDQRYQRALLVFNESFNSNRKEIRFLMLIMTLECLFNYRLALEDSISDRVASFSSKILSLNPNDYNINYELFKSFYNKRSKYVHGEAYAIKNEDELKLRRYVRIIMLVFSALIMNSKGNFSNVIKYLKNENFELPNELRIFLFLLLSMNPKYQCDKNDNMFYIDLKELSF